MSQTDPYAYLQQVAARRHGSSGRPMAPAKKSALVTRRWRPSSSPNCC